VILRRSTPGLALLLSGLLAGAVVAQADPHVASAPASPQPSAPGNTVSGVTVQAPAAPKEACSARDKDCIAAVVADLKAHYPNELQKWCDYVQQRAAQQEMTFPRYTTGGAEHPNYMPYRPPEVTRVACVGIPKVK
jgi:hypothetical protein